MHPQNHGFSKSPRFSYNVGTPSILHLNRKSTLMDTTAKSSALITVVVTGGIAAYKTCEFVRLLRKAGLRVRVVMTRSAAEFIGPVTFEALSGESVLVEGAASGAMPHIEATRGAALTVVMPATANTLAKMAQGIADTMVSSLLLASRSPVLVVPGMNEHMWNNPATQRNVSLLKQDGIQFAGPVEGFQACGDVGAGRMMEPADVFSLVEGMLAEPFLKGRRVLVTAGPTFEAIDPVRGITNVSSGRQGFAFAKAARLAGARVTLVSGPVSLPTPAGVERIDVTSARSMLKAVKDELTEHRYDIFVGVAAVADWAPKNTAKQKIKKTGEDDSPFSHLEWKENPDILKYVGHRRSVGCVIGFAAETDLKELENYARGKLEKKNADMIVGNYAPKAFGSKTNQALLVTRGKEASVELPRTGKEELARTVLMRAKDYLEEHAMPTLFSKTH